MSQRRSLTLGTKMTQVQNRIVHEGMIGIILSDRKWKAAFVWTLAI